MRFVVRQPVFNQQEHVEGYELNIENRMEDVASPAEIVDTVLVALQRLPTVARATILGDLPLLKSEVVRKLPPCRVVLAIDPGGADVEEVLRIGGQMRKADYSLTLLNFERDSGVDPLLGLLDSVGVATRRDMAALKLYVQGKSGLSLRLIARQVSTRADRIFAEESGFRYFQGEYFLHPSRELNREVPSSKVASLELLKELRLPVLNLRALEVLIKAEPSFCYRLLRYLNSAAFFGMQKVTSIRHAMSLLGDDELRRWLSLMAMVAAAEGKSSEVVVTAMLRAKFCELLSREAPDYGFMIGLFSLMPTIINMQLGALLSVVRLPARVDAALWGEAGALRTLLDLSLAFERAQWRMVRDLAQSLRLSDEEVFGARGEATRWSNEILAAQSCAPVGMPA